MIEIHCPGTILKPDSRIYDCGALLCKAEPGSDIEIVCRRCKNKMRIIVNKDLNGNAKVNIKQTRDS